MSTPLPFHVAPEAEQRLLGVSIEPDSEPGIMYTLGYRIHNPEGELTEEFRGEHYSIGFDTPSRWQAEHRATRIEIAGRQFWMSTGTLDTLRGKTLNLVQRDVGRGNYAGKTRDLLVAT
jgi:hypothetical protein